MPIASRDSALPRTTAARPRTGAGAALVRLARTVPASLKGCCPALAEAGPSLIAARVPSRTPPPGACRVARPVLVGGGQIRAISAHLVLGQTAATGPGRIPARARVQIAAPGAARRRGRCPGPRRVTDRTARTADRLGQARPGSPRDPTTPPGRAVTSAGSQATGGRATLSSGRTGGPSGMTGSSKSAPTGRSAGRLATAWIIGTRDIGRTGAPHQAGPRDTSGVPRKTAAPRKTGAPRKTAAGRRTGAPHKISARAKEAGPTRRIRGFVIRAACGQTRARGSAGGQRRTAGTSGPTEMATAG